MRFLAKARNDRACLDSMEREGDSLRRIAFPFPLITNELSFRMERSEMRNLRIKKAGFKTGINPPSGGKMRNP
jgi:hypothetical protein